METKELQMELLLKQDHEGEIALYQPDENINIEVRIDCEKNTVWLSIDQMATLFARDKSVIGKHIRNIFKEGELKKDPVWAKYAYTASDGKTYSVDFYNLDVIISVGYRVRSAQGIAFRIWASKVLKDYLLNGYAVNRQLVALQGRTVSLKATSQRVHDRFLIIDDEVYHLGASLNELGRRLFAFSRMLLDKKVLLGMI